MARKKVHPNFAAYAKFIVNHPTYEGMPDPYKDDGGVQWETPSNRGPGKFQHSHRKRLEWWRNKALAVGIDPNPSQWISRTAKQIHPTNEKPCSVCGREMDLRYAYPTEYLLRRIEKLEYFDGSFELSPLEHIKQLVSRLYERFGDRIFDNLGDLLRTGAISPPNLGRSLGAWLGWVETTYIPQEPTMLSPGAMANPPDRFDGFHTYNRCCRPTQDKGRDPENLKTYSTDRRGFEF